MTVQCISVLRDSSSSAYVGWKVIASYFPVNVNGGIKTSRRQLALEACKLLKVAILLLLQCAVAIADE